MKNISQYSEDNINYIGEFLRAVTYHFDQHKEQDKPMEIRKVFTRILPCKEGLLCTVYSAECSSFQCKLIIIDSSEKIYFL